TTIAPAYTITVAAAKKGALCSRNSPQTPSVTIANHNAEYTGLRFVIIGMAERIATPENVQSRIACTTCPLAGFSRDANKPAPNMATIHPTIFRTRVARGIQHHTSHA